MKKNSNKHNSTKNQHHKYPSIQLGKTSKLCYNNTVYQVLSAAKNKNIDIINNYPIIIKDEESVPARQQQITRQS